MKIYIEHRIDSEKDLPQKEGWYIVKCADNENPEFMKKAKKGNIFWGNAAWWLEPIEISGEDIQSWAKEQFMPAKDYSHLTEIQEAILICFKAGCSYGAKSALSGQIKKRK